MVPSATIAFLHRLLMWWWAARVSLQWWRKLCCTACRVSGSKIANICTSWRLLLLRRYLCPTLHSVPVNCGFYLYLLVCWYFQHEGKLFCYFSVCYFDTNQLCRSCFVWCLGTSQKELLKEFNYNISISAKCIEPFWKATCLFWPRYTVSNCGRCCQKGSWQKASKKIYCRKAQHIFGSTMCSVTKTYLSAQCKAEVKINLQFQVASLLFWFVTVTKR